MRRLRNIALWAAAIGIFLPVALLLAVLVAANTAPGQALIARLAGRFSGGMVMLSGLHGRFPDRLRLDRLEMHDRAGVWLTADGVALDWSPISLISLQALVDNVAIAHLALTRLPAPAPAAQAPAPAKGGFSLPVRVTLRAVHVGQADIAAAGANSSLKIDGAADVVSLRQGEVTLAADRLDSPGTYRVAARLDHGDLEAKLSATEPAHGLIGTLAQLPDLGAISLLAGVTGPKGAERTDVSLHAGQLSATLHGVVDLNGQAATLDVAANAPAMQPRPDISWQGIDLRAHVNGRFTSPDAAAHLVVRNLAAGGASMQTLTADAGGNRGKVDLHAVLQGLRLPGPKPDVFAQAPWDLTLQAMLDQPDRPVSFTLTHPLLTARGTAKTAGDITAEVHAVVADIAPLAALGNVDLRGSTDAVARLAMHGGDTQVSVQGTADFTGGQAPVPSLLGPTRFSAAAGLAGQDITVNSVQVDGRGLHAHVSGTDRPAGLDLDWQLGLTDLALAAPQLTGALQAEGHAGGKQSGLAVTATIHGDVGTRTIRKGPVTVSLRATGLPASPAGSIEATGRLDGSDLVLAADISRDAGGITRALLKQAKWKSLSASADATLQPGGVVPQGRIQARMGRLADLAALTGLDLSGGATASIVSEGQGSAMDTKIDVRGSDLSVQANRVGALKLAGRVTGAPDRPDLDLLMTADGIDAAGVTGAARATAKGTLGALDLAASAGLHNVAGDDASVSTTARLDTAAKTILLRRLDAAAKGLALRLQAPARIDYAAGLAVDRLVLALGGATAEIAGRISPKLDLKASLRNVTPDLAKPFAPGLAAQGVLTADAQLTGTMAAPVGNLRVSGHGLRMSGGPGAAMPAASLAASIGLNGHAASVDARMDAGPKLHLTASGTVPLQSDGALSISGTGRLDLTVLDPILQAEGRRAQGQVVLDVRATGSTARPVLNGRLDLAKSEVQDFAQGVRIHDIVASVAADGDTLRIARFTGQAGQGSIDVAGSLGFAAAGMPVDLHILAKQAKPLVSDLLTATLDADVTLRGQAEGTMDASGTIFLHQVDINVPDGLPPSVAVLNVHKPGYTAPARAAAPPSAVRLALTIEAPARIFVRGHGLDAELGGTLHVGGLATAPLVSGAFDMRRGDFSLAGTTLSFSKGTVGFNGTVIGNRIDPTLDFEADSYANAVTATLGITGYADAPKIKLSSVPDLPQDEVLAQLLFGESMKQLSAIQIAQIGAALAEITGVTGGGNPLDSVRKGLGLDRLSVGGGTNGAGATVEAGRYVAKGVYVGARQGAGGAGGTQAQVQVDLTKHLKLLSALGTGGSTQGATPQNDPGSSVGLSYQFEY